MILPDYPIENSEADKLRRAPLASKVAELVRNFEGKESFVIGIEGVWGSGKTSFINLALKELEGSENTIIVHFNPWNFSGQNELITDFFATLHSAIKNEKEVRHLAKTLQSYASKLQVSFSPSVPIPYLGSIGFGEVWKSGSTTLQEERQRIDNQLRALSKKIVIVIDDIDRLDEKETRLIMKLVKMTANFPNTVFLLAYDREQVAEKLGTKGVGEEYLKKIIQVSFTLPQPDELGLRNILFGDLDQTIASVYGEVNLEGQDEKRWGSIVYAGFPNLFKTIRDIKRFISSLRLNWSIVQKEDINMVDFITIEAIRVVAPQFYASISANKSLFTGGEISLPSLQSRDEANKAARYKELLEKVPPDCRTIVEKICDELFPPLGSGYGYDWQQEWRREHRICAEERFGFYFQLGVPEGAISETEITEVLKSLEKGTFKDVVLGFFTDKRIRPMLSKLLDYTNKLDTEKAKELVKTLWNLQKTVDDERSGVFDVDDVETQTMRLVYHSIKNGVPENERGAFLKEVIEASEDLYPPTHFMVVVRQELEKKGGQSERALVTEEDLKEPEAILLKRIKERAGEGKLSEEENFAFFLYWWKKWGGDEEPTKYVTELVKTTQGVGTFLKGFLGKVYSSNGNYYQLNKKGLFDFLPEVTLDPLVKAISEEEIKKMDSKMQEAIEKYKNPPKDPWANI